MTTSEKKEPKRIWGISYTEMAILVVLLSIGFVLVGFILRTFNSRTGSSPISSPVPSTVPLEPLSSLALNKSRIEAALQLSTPLQQAPSSMCDNSTVVECFSSGFISKNGDYFVLLLQRFSDEGGALNYGIARQKQLRKEHNAIDIDIPTTPGNQRWLMTDILIGKPTYYGGANNGEVSIHMIWSRTSSMISDAEAVQGFSRLLDAQISKIRSSQ
jgi:hypothetical protein